MQADQASSQAPHIFFSCFQNAVVFRVVCLITERKEKRERIEIIVVGLMTPTMQGPVPRMASWPFSVHMVMASKINSCAA